MSKILDYISANDRAEFDAIIARATEAKKNAPKPEKGKRAPMSETQKAVMAEKREIKEANKWAEKLAAAKAARK